MQKQKKNKVWLIYFGPRKLILPEIWRFVAYFFRTIFSETVQIHSRFFPCKTGFFQSVHVFQELF